MPTSALLTWHPCGKVRAFYRLVFGSDVITCVTVPSGTAHEPDVVPHSKLAQSARFPVPQYRGKPILVVTVSNHKSFRDTKPRQPSNTTYTAVFVLNPFCAPYMFRVASVTEYSRRMGLQS